MNRLFNYSLVIFLNEGCVINEATDFVRPHFGPCRSEGTKEFQKWNCMSVSAIICSENCWNDRDWFSYGGERNYKRRGYRFSTCAQNDLWQLWGGRNLGGKLVAMRYHNKPMVASSIVSVRSTLSFCRNLGGELCAMRYHNKPKVASYCQCKEHTLVSSISAHMCISVFRSARFLHATRFVYWFSLFSST